MTSSTHLDIGAGVEEMAQSWRYIHDRHTWHGKLPGPEACVSVHVCFETLLAKMAYIFFPTRNLIPTEHCCAEDGDNVNNPIC